MPAQAVSRILLADWGKRLMFSAACDNVPHFILLHGGNAAGAGERVPALRECERRKCRMGPKAGFCRRMSDLFLNLPYFDVENRT
jgi:hypothetical protein